MIVLLTVVVWLAGAIGAHADQAAGASPSAPAFVADIQVHGNLATPEETILELSGVAVGTPFDDAMPERVAERLRAAERFDSVEVLKRFASITDLSKIVLVIVVDDGPVDVDWGADDLSAAVRQRGGTRPMFHPILNREDGHGFTYGVGIAFVLRRTNRARLSFPLTWGGQKRAAVELDMPVSAGPLTRLTAGASVSRQEHPFFEVDDDRQTGWVRGERRFSPSVVGGAFMEIGRVTFAGDRDDLRRLGVDVVLDTRRDPVLPRDAVYARAEWERVDASGTSRSRRELDLRGYVGLLGQNVLAVRGTREHASGGLPPYLQPMLGGTDNLRGLRAGTEANDMLTAASLELLVPFSSPLGIVRTGMTAFLDVGAAYPSGQSVHRQKFSRGIGGSYWITLTVLRAEIAVARGLGEGTRAHFALGTTF